MVRFQSYESALASNYILIVGIIWRSHLVASKAKVIRLNPRPMTSGHIDRGLCNQKCAAPCGDVSLIYLLRSVESFTLARGPQLLDHSSASASQCVTRNTSSSKIPRMSLWHEDIRCKESPAQAVLCPKVGHSSIHPSTNACIPHMYSSNHSSLHSGTHLHAFVQHYMEYFLMKPLQSSSFRLGSASAKFSPPSPPQFQSGRQPNSAAFVSSSCELNVHWHLPKWLPTVTPIYSSSLLPAAKAQDVINCNLSRLLGIWDVESWKAD